MKLVQIASLWIYFLIGISGAVAEDNILYLGCFKDAPIRRLNGYYIRDANLSTKQCFKECRDRGFVYAALQVGVECFCGNNQEALKETVAETECNVYCAGEDSKRCGGEWRNNVYSIKNCDKVTASNESAIYLGCFKDNANHKLTGHYMKDIEHLTHEKCIKECQNRGFLYAGLQGHIGEECYCGNEQKILEERTPDEECNVPCTGDKSKMCGGDWRVTLYSVAKCEEAEPSVEENAINLGCFKDNPIRRLNGYYFRHIIMSTGKCIQECRSRGFVYAALQVGIECFCGSSQIALKENVDDTECNTYCLGEGSKRCGGEWRNNVYSVKNCDKVTASKEPPLYLGCFKDNANHKLTGHYIKDTDNLTHEKCIKECQSRGFLYAGLQGHIGEECYCGNEQKILEERTPDEECNVPCTGDKSKMCGGDWRMTLYSVAKCEEDSSSKDTAIYLGCFKDYATHKLTGHYFNDFEYLTHEKCIKECQLRGFLYAGLQGHRGEECFCGNEQSVLEEGTPDNECNAQCTGDRTKMCGGDWRMSVYSVKKCDKVGRGKAIYLGCFKDYAKHKLKGYYLKDTEHLTHEKCIKECQSRGFLYAGLQGHVGEECYCGNEQNILEERTPDDECNAPCTGDHSKMCGGDWRMTLYSVGKCVQTKHSAQDNAIDLGCFKDNAERRVRGHYFKDVILTPEKCIEECSKRGFVYAALQIGVECFCGNDQIALKEKAADTECNVHCAGEGSKTCGGEWRNNIYSVNNCDKVVGSLSPALYLGCFEDNSGRKLTGHYLKDTEHLTHEKCIKECRDHGFLYAGLEGHIGEECWCGNQQNILGERAPEYECNKPCTGDRSKMCGGDWRMNLYSVRNCGEGSEESPIIEVPVYEGKTLDLGCFKDNTTRRVVGHYFRDANLSTQKCIQECRSRGYVYAALQVGIECYCGNGQVALKDKLPESDCNFRCAGEKSKRCGGNWKFNLFSIKDCGKVTDSNERGVYLGCFKDNANRKLKGHYFKDTEHLTHEKCIKECQSRGFLYAGLQGHIGEECYCGNQQNILEERTSESECNKPCTGDSSTMCGGDWRMTLYSVGTCVQGVSDHMYLGCFKDFPARRLSGGYLKDTTMTAPKCVEFCKSKGFFYAGLQVGVECFCGSQRTSLENKVLDEECNFPCSGDNSKKCGGTWRNTIYSTSNIERRAYKGCYKDDVNRIIKGQYFIIDYGLDGMTPAKCLYLCGQYRFMYAGLQVGVECYCGNQQLLSANKVKDSECNFGCTGDYSKKCGGNWRNTVYSTGYTLEDVESPRKELNYLGCYEDFADKRQFKEYFYKSETMLPETCVHHCKTLGYSYAAVQVGSECYCGDTPPSASDKVNEDDCQFVCFGDYSRKCGGTLKNSVYSTQLVSEGKTSAIDASYIYSGCYKSTLDEESNKHQDFGLSFTPRICIEFCQRYGLPYAALHAGTKCKCLSTIPLTKASPTSSQCITKCAGDNTKICGGMDMDSVYETETSDITRLYYKTQYVGCYKEDTNVNSTYYFTSQNMSVGRCITVCKYYGYLYANLTNGNECYCGDNQVQYADKIADELCNLPCPSESQSKCGGKEKHSVFNTGNVGPGPKVADFGVEHIGCFKEQIKYSELRAYIVDYEDQLEPKTCVNVCSRLGFKFTGLLSGSQCLCGNKQPSQDSKVPNDECNTRCTGEKASICGGNSRVTVYKTTIQSVDGEIDIRSRYLGCYRDQGDPRALRGSYKVIDKLTPWKCVKECKKKNYLYAGLQVGNECYCGDQHPQLSERLPETSCNFQCFGDLYRFCGGNWANTIYHTSSTGSEARIAEIGYRYLGCYKDQENPRQLSSYFSSFANTLTPLSCVELCKKRGYYYAGLQYGDKCFCGDDHPKPTDLDHENKCNSKCTGDVKKLCGGDRRNLIYFTGNNDFASVENRGLNYLGCYKDEETQRHLQGHFQNYNEELTPNKCVTLCKNRGYLYAGLQNSSYCFCGDQYPSPSDKLADPQCNSRCTGDTAKICGGILRNTIYATGYSGSAAEAAETDHQYIGCYTKQTPVQLSAKSQNFENSLTPQKCVEFCKETGHLYCALYNSTWCYCGDSSPSQTDKVPEGECSSQCLGDISKICGGPAAFTGYITANTLENFDTKVLQNEKKCITSETIVNGGQTCRGSVVFEETFSAPISTRKWSHVVEFADEPDFPFVVFNLDKTNSYTDDDKLIIKPSILPSELVKRGEIKLKECTSKSDSKLCSKHAKSYLILPPVQTARLTTRNSFNFRYGKVEIIAKFPVGDWIIPEIWLEPKERTYGPGYISGRINLAMSRGNRDLNLEGTDLSCHHLESGVMVGIGEVIKENNVVMDLDKCWNEDFHNYTLIWAPDNIIFFIDGVETKPLLPNQHTTLSQYLQFSKDVSSLWRFGSKMAPFDTEFYIHVGLSVGGIRNFPDDVLNRGENKPWRNKELRSFLNFWKAQKDWEPTWVGGSSLEIEYIKVTSL